MTKMCFTNSLFLVALLLCSPEATTQALTDDVLSALTFRNVGPTRGGRVTTVASHPDHQGTFYMGATGGGVWKTDDYGQSWKNISDGYFQTGSIGSIAVAPSNPKILFVGTGSDGLRSNVIIGKGIYRSNDAGKTWTRLGLEQSGQITSVLIHPRDTNIVYAAAIGNPFKNNPERGIYKSTNGGQDWSLIYHHSDSVGVVDLEFAPGNPQILYASLWRARRKPWTIISGAAKVGGLLKSANGGVSWQQLHHGLPQGLIGKSDLAVCPTSPQSVWALIEAPHGEGGVFVSHDQGETFAQISTKKELLDRPFYYCNIDVNPLNPKTLYVNSTRFWKSTNGGKTWSSQATPHGDNHDMWIHPADSNLFVQANDGGANVTRDGGRTWSSILNQPTAELYQVAVDDQYPYWLYAGQQDNSTIAVPSHPPYRTTTGPQQFWRSTGGCETGPVIPKPGAPHIVYANCKGRFGVFNQQTGQEKQYYVGATNIYGHHPKDLKFRFQRVAPIHVSPHNPDVIYHASQYVHKTTDDGKTWEIISPDLTAFKPETQVISGTPITRDITGEEYFSTIYAVQESAIDRGLIWVGSNDGLVHVTRDGGQNWSKVTPPLLPPHARIQTIEPSRHRAGRAYVAAYRYLMGDFKPYIFKTDNFGASWSLLTSGSNGIPNDHPTRVVREDPEVAEILYAGTEFGLFISTDEGENWTTFQQNLPVTPITDIKLAHGDLILSTMGRSFWILDQIATVRQAVKTTLTSHVLFHPDPAIRTRYRSSASIPTYPSPGLVIDYYLGAKPSREVRIEITDMNGMVIRRFSSLKPQPEKENEEDMATGEGYQAPAVKIFDSAGGHRVIWDMRNEGLKRNSDRHIPGPLVAPGKFRMTLFVDDHAYTNEVEVKMDPRIAQHLSEDALSQQEDLQLKILDALKRALSLRKSIEDRKKELGENAQIPEDLLAMDAALNTADGRYHQPKLIDQLRYLYSMLDRADQMPGKDAYERYDHLNNLLLRLQIEAKGIELLD